MSLMIKELGQRNEETFFQIPLPSRDLPYSVIQALKLMFTSFPITEPLSIH